MTDQTLPLGEGWDSHAQEWITWARIPGRDSYDEFHRDAFLPLVPSPGRLTVDIGCGEGRLSRDLQVLGHHVLAADLSLTMSRAAVTHPASPVPAVVADATRCRWRPAPPTAPWRSCPCTTSTTCPPRSRKSPASSTPAGTW